MSSKTTMFLRSYLFQPLLRNSLWRNSLAKCSTSSGASAVESPQTVGSQDAESTSPWNPKNVEELLLSESAKDLPVDMPNPYEEEREQCLLCKYNVHLDYKNPRLLSQFISPYTGRVYGRHITRLCRRQQGILETEIAKSRDAGFMAIMLKSVEFLKDPKLFDPNNPDRPHNF